VSDDFQVGRMVQAIRLAHNLRQEDVASRAGVSRRAVSRLERGLVDGMTVGSLRAISRAMGMPSIAWLGWRTPEVDRLRDRLHAAMVEEVTSKLSSLGWVTAPEHSFNHYGERGSVDVLGWHASLGALLIVETKTRIWDIGDLLVTLDRKRRLLPKLAAAELGWQARVVGIVLVLPEMSTHRHVIARHGATFRSALPRRQSEVRDWLLRPAGDMRGIWFLPISHQDNIGQRSRRLRASKRRRAPLEPAKSPPAQPKLGARDGPGPGNELHRP
jgi:transcriptional regulator with XRE-family HTH domain